MATIQLYADKVNQMNDLLLGIRNTIDDYVSENTSLQVNAQLINTSICDTSIVQTNISFSITIGEEELESLDKLIDEFDEFVSLAKEIDDDVADEIVDCKDDFYKDYSYLKPDSEKSDWENFWEDVGEWAKENWKVIVLVVLVVAAVVIIIVTGGAATGPIAMILVGIAKGILVGAAVGGLSGGIFSAITGGSFIDGFIDGAFSGAIAGAITGGIAGAMGGMAAFEGLSTGMKGLINGGADMFATLIGDIGDNIFTDNDKSALHIIFDGLFSFGASFLGEFFLADIEAWVTPKLNNALTSVFKNKLPDFISNKLPTSIADKLPDALKNGFDVDFSKLKPEWLTGDSNSVLSKWKDQFDNLGTTAVSRLDIFKGIGAETVDGLMKMPGEFLKNTVGGIFDFGFSLVF